MTPIALSVVLKWLNYSSFIKSDDSAGVSCADFLLTGFAAIDKASETDVSFWLGKTTKNETNANGVSVGSLVNVKAGLLFVPSESLKNLECASVDDFKKYVPGVRCVIPVVNPYHAMVEFLKQFGSESLGLVTGCATTATVHPSAVVEGYVGENSTIGPNCVIMRGATVGENCVLEANVTVYPNVVVGNDCVIQAGVVLGSRGFGFYEYEGKRLPVPHPAGVRIGERCSFGANTVVAAGFVSPTTIGNDCHFDSFVQIAHNCNLGNNIYMASQSGIAGTVTVEDDVEFAGGAQSAGHLTIGKGARIAAKAGVTKSVPAGKVVAGFPAEDINSWRKSVVNLRLLAKN